ncbi:MAG: AraC family transcriptional regulator, partial [Pseudomonadales bacterium]|nr:AraC family transcriptional regulator [Pseudomonadales bacterium]
GNDYLRCHNQSHLSARQLQFSVEFVFGTFLRVGPLLSGHENIVKEVHFTCDTSNALEYETVFQCPILFKQPFNQLVLPAGMANKPLASYCPELENDAITALKKKISILAKNEGIITQVIHVLRQLDGGETLNIDITAKELNVSVRSLQRKLKESGVTFSAVRVEFLIEQSKTLLEQPDLTMDMIAERLGFSDRAAFSRSFKRIEGVSPSQYRQQP